MMRKYGTKFNYYLFQNACHRRRAGRTLRSGVIRAGESNPGGTRFKLELVPSWHDESFEEARSSFLLCRNMKIELNEEISSVSTVRFSEISASNEFESGAIPSTLIICAQSSEISSKALVPLAVVTELICAAMLEFGVQKFQFYVPNLKRWRTF